jgi:branched-chain amino acid transport system substrate-binding protein
MSMTTRDIRRRTLVHGLAATAVTAPFILRHASAQQSGPIRIGFSAPLSGAQQLVGTPIRIGAEVARDQVNAAGGINGRMLELVIVDDKGDPAQAVANVRQFTSDGINLICGIPLTATALAVIGVIQSLGGIYVATGSNDDRLTHELFTRNFFTTAENNYMRLRAFSQHLAKRHPDATAWTSIFPDVSIGHASWKRMATSLQEAYKTTGKEVRLIDPILTKFGADVVGCGWHLQRAVRR